MYRLEVMTSQYGCSYHVYCGDVVAVHGYRGTEKEAREDGYEDMKLCRMFGVGYKQD